MAGPVSYPARKTVTLSVTVTAPGWLGKSHLRREVRTLLTEGTVYGTERPQPVDQPFAPYDAIHLGDIRVKRVR